MDKLSCLARGFVCGEFRNLKDGVVRSASKVISNSDWSLPQLRLLVKKVRDNLLVFNLEKSRHVRCL